MNPRLFFFFFSVVLAEFTLSGCKKKEESQPNIPKLKLFDIRPGLTNYTADLTDHNTVILIGKTNSNGSNHLMECDFSGNIIAEFDINLLSSGSPGCKAIGNKYLFFSSNYTALNNYDFFVSQYSQNGTEQWNKSIGTEDLEQPRCLKVTADGNIFIAGIKISSSSSVRSIYTAALDANGNILWTREIPATSSTYIPQDILVTPQNELLVFVNNNAGGMIIHHIYANGSGVKSVNVEMEGSIAAAAYLNNGEIICCGNGSNSDVLLVKLTGKLEKIWSKNLGKSDHSEFSTALIQNEDGTIGISGFVVGQKTKSYDALYIKTNVNGDPLIYRGFGDQSTDQAYQILNHHDGDNLLLGLTFTNSQGGGFLQQTFLTEIDSRGNFK